jgi:hypothetical protein
MYLFIYLFIYVCIYVIIYLFIIYIYLFVRSFIHLYIYISIYIYRCIFITSMLGFPWHGMAYHRLASTLAHAVCGSGEPRWDRRCKVRKLGSRGKVGSIFWNARHFCKVWNETMTMAHS